MVKIYFVRHAQPKHEHKDDRTRPLTEEGMLDSRQVTKFLSKLPIDSFYSSPYKRSIDTIAESAQLLGKNIITDERLREREKGFAGNTHCMFRKRWNDFNFHEEGGESLSMVQKRNIEALHEIIQTNDGKTIVIGTHGTALSSILRHYELAFGCEDFLRIIDWMPYIVELQFEDGDLISKTEHLHCKKKFLKKKITDK